MPQLAFILCLCASNLAAGPDPAPAPPAELSTIPFESSRYGVKTAMPKAWPIAVREEEDRVFVALIAQTDPDRPGIAACELGLAPESLDEYRTRIDGNAKRGGRPGATLIRNEVVKGPKGEQLESVWEFRRPVGLSWRERTVRIVANRQMYTFTLNVDDATYPRAQAVFEAIIAATEFSPPNTGADRLDRDANRWAQREFRFALDLPDGWQPVLAPSEVALFFANGPAHGIWSDNVLVLAQAHRTLDLQAMAREVPDQLRQVEPNCEVLSCQVVKQGPREALETVVRTRRGPFSMTILERRFRGDRFDYEVKYTVESKRFDELAPALRKSLDSFSETPGPAPAVNPARST